MAHHIKGCHWLFPLTNTSHNNYGILLQELSSQTQRKCIDTIKFMVFEENLAVSMLICWWIRYYKIMIKSCQNIFTPFVCIFHILITLRVPLDIFDSDSTTMRKVKYCFGEYYVTITIVINITKFHKKICLKFQNNHQEIFLLLLTLCNSFSFLMQDNKGFI